MLRVAAVQLHYLPAYHADGVDYLSAPLETPLRVATPETADRLNDWRRALRRCYCASHARKLERIVRYCAQQACDLIVFPEYSVPVECLNTLRQLSRELGIAILAGSSRITRTQQGLTDLLPELDIDRFHGWAVAPLFERGHATFLPKTVPSRYDPDIGHDSTLFKPPQRTTLGGVRLDVWLCSDYLAKHALVEDSADIDIVVSFTPALGDFVLRMQDTSDEDAIRRAHRLHKDGVGTIFANNAERGGTKAFFQNRHHSPNSMDEADGSYGLCEIAANRVTKCGLPAGSEGLIIIDYTNGALHPFAQHSVVPILHCASPDDEAVAMLSGFLEQYDASATLASKQQRLRLWLPSVQRETTHALHPVLTSLYAHLTRTIDSVDDEALLDRLVSVCVVHEEAPSLSSWMYRASGATLDVIRELPQDSDSTGAFSQTIATCSDTVVKLRSVREVRIGELETSGVPGAVSPIARLELSGPVRTNVINSRSGSGALVAAVTLVRHLLGATQVDDAHRVLEQIRTVRPYVGLDILDDLRSALSAPSPDISDALACCDTFLEERRREKASMGEACASASTLADGALIAFGYSDLVLTFLRALSGPKRHVFVAECRNRSHVEAGLAYADAIERLGFPVTFVSDSTLARLMSDTNHRVGTVLMGFTVAGPDGIINTVGSLGAAVLARHYAVELVFVGQSFKITSGSRWDSIRRRSLESRGDGWWLGDRSTGRLALLAVSDPRSDLVPWALVSRVLTEHGAHSPTTIAQYWTA